MGAATLLEKLMRMLKRHGMVLTAMAAIVGGMMIGARGQATARPTTMAATRAAALANPYTKPAATTPAAVKNPRGTQIFRLPMRALPT